MEEKPRTHARPVTTRSRLVLEMASELVGIEEWKDKQIKLQLREQGAPQWNLCFFASDAPSGIEEVIRGDADLGIINPVEPLTLAYRGTGPYKNPSPLRVITTIPSADQLGFAAMKNLEAGGRVTLIAANPELLQIPIRYLMIRNIEFTSTTGRHYADVPELLALARAGVIDTGPISSRAFPLEAANQALDYIKTRGDNDPRWPMYAPGT